MTIWYPPYQYLKFEILELCVRALNMFSPTKIVMLKNCIQLTGLKIAKNVVDQEKHASFVIKTNWFLYVGNSRLRQLQQGIVASR